MGDVVNLNRYRTKKALQEKERRAETNRRLHGRTKAERAREDAQKKHIEDKLDGAYLVREDVTLADVPGASLEQLLEHLDAAAERAISLHELSREPEKSKE
jgi:hypothetical protein